jgi:hypothetical protein
MYSKSMTNQLEDSTIKTNNSSSCDPHDLPEEYKEHGWRKCYSKREKRYYYYNKYSHESIWTLNELFELVS